MSVVETNSAARLCSMHNGKSIKKRLITYIIFLYTRQNLDFYDFCYAITSFFLTTLFLLIGVSGHFNVSFSAYRFVVARSACFYGSFPIPNAC